MAKAAGARNDLDRPQAATHGLCSDLLGVSDRRCCQLVLHLPKQLPLGVQFAGKLEQATGARLEGCEAPPGLFETPAILALLIVEAVESVLKPRDGAKWRDLDGQIDPIFRAGALKQRFVPIAVALAEPLPP